MIRDYFYIEDGVEAYLTLAENITRSEIQGQAFNFSNEEPLDVMSIVYKVLQVMGSDLEPLILNQASNEITSQYLSSEKAKNLLKCKPIYSMKEGLKRTVEWYRDFFWK